MVENEKEDQNPNGIEPESTEQKKGGFEAFVSTAMRTARRGIREQLMTQLLIRGNMSGSPLVKVQAICEAVGMSQKKDRIDMNLVECIFLVSTSLINTEKSNISAQHNPGLIRCSWSFKQTEENYKKCIKAWHVLELQHYPLDTAYVEDNYPDFSPVCNYSYSGDVDQWHKCKDEILEEVREWFKKTSDSKAFYEQTYALSRLSFSELKGEFEAWAIMQLRPIEAIVSEEITPEVYRDVLTALMQKSQKQGEEQESESAMG